MGMALAAMVSLASGASAQGARGGGVSTYEFMAGQPEAGAIVRSAPYSGEATTTVMQTLADGTRIERTTVARMVRDSEGRVRREQTVQGIGALNATGETTVITIVDAVANVSYVLDPAARTARRLDLRVANLKTRLDDVLAGQARGRVGGGPVGPPPPPPPPGARGRGRQQGPNAATMPPPPPPPPPPPVGQSLGTKKIEGLDAVGTRFTATIETGRIGNDRPIEITDERWESPALKILVQSRHSDPRTGVVEYRLTNISRAEPSHDLFIVPPDYTIVEARDER
jgi:hypothetical protein